MKVNMSWIGRLRRSRNGGYRAPAEADDYAISRRMRDAAVRLRTDGRSWLRPEGDVKRRVHALCEEAVSLRKSSTEEDAALERLCQDAGLMEMCAAQAAAEPVRGLPSCDGEARIGRAVAAMYAREETPLTVDGLLLAIKNQQRTLCRHTGQRNTHPRNPAGGHF